VTVAVSDKDDPQAGDVVRHVKMRHHEEHVGVARQRVGSHSRDDTSKLRIKLQLLCTHVYMLLAMLEHGAFNIVTLKNSGKIKILPLVFSISQPQCKMGFGPCQFAQVGRV
jgi:hypothetical protein